MAKVTVKTQFDIASEIEGFFNSSTVRELGNTVIQGIEERVAVGLSPVAKHGRYKKYSDSYTRSIKRGQIKGKTVRPVNLWKTGDMMRSLEYKPIKDGTKLGFFGGKTADIAGFHQDGTEKMPMRRILPKDEEEEDFTPGIQNDIKDVYQRRLFDIIERSNK